MRRVLFLQELKSLPSHHSLLKISLNPIKNGTKFLMPKHYLITKNKYDI